MKILIILVLVNISLYSQTIPGIENIKKENLLNTVKLLSSEKYEGRLPGTKGYNMAVEYAVASFQKYLKPINKSYVQKFKIESNEVTKADITLKIKNEVLELELGKDFICRGFTGSGDVKSQVVFCGYGLDQENYSDYKDVNVKDKIVMVYKGTPSWYLNGIGWSNTLPRQKAATASKYGAKGIILISFPNDKNPQKPIASVLHGDGEQNENFPQIHIDLPVAEKLFNSAGVNGKDIQTEIDSFKTTKTIFFDAQAELNIEADYEKEADTYNVLGMLEGKDPVLKDEYIIVGAHLDHVGKQADLIFPGANDNASGSAAVLELLKAFVQSGIEPKRSIIFVLFSGEEQGLNGASFFASNMPISKNQVKAMINMDCIAYGDSIQVGGGISAPELYEIVKEQNEKLDKKLVDRTWKGGGADAEPFYNKGIKTLYFVTTNSYAHLHLASDTYETLNPELYEQLVRLAYATIYEIGHKEYL